MTTEEKARAYDEALKVLHKYDGAHIMLTQDLKEEMFPELKESEDERIRKAIIESLGRYGYLPQTSIKVEDAIAWLEKQGETSPILSNSSNIGKNEDKVEPKFKVDEWITNSIETVQITGYDIDYGYQVDYKGNLQHRDTDIIEKEYHPWTIQNAKDGDVLSNGKMIVIFKHFEEPSYRQQIVAYIGLDTSGDIQITDDIWVLGIGKAKPATKEQRDQLEKAMVNAGYKWDADKKELKKIEQKPAWSEEDERICNAIINDIATEKSTCYSKIAKGICDEQTNWLKSLKDRYA